MFDEKLVIRTFQQKIDTYTRDIDKAITELKRAFNVELGPVARKITENTKDVAQSVENAVQQQEASFTSAYIAKKAEARKRILELSDEGRIF